MSIEIRFEKENDRVVIEGVSELARASRAGRAAILAAVASALGWSDSLPRVAAAMAHDFVADVVKGLSPEQRAKARERTREYKRKMKREK